ncbi:hypothetical protein KQX54_015355 [Cotesia glomerata]|uniref:Secreted protein n=1 Tax=Cotesia glomerata TaxID=32391 RepID=A0AAV7IYM7_COTGL|nr:hypothetical protein KQX54_015355 [Cotesia glomerata]
MKASLISSAMLHIIFRSHWRRSREPRSRGSLRGARLSQASPLATQPKQYHVIELSSKLPLTEQGDTDSSLCATSRSCTQIDATTTLCSTAHKYSAQAYRYRENFNRRCHVKTPIYRDWCTLRMCYCMYMRLMYSQVDYIH